MHLTPRQGFDGRVDDVSTVLADLQDAGHGETRTAVAVILDDDLGVLFLDHARQAAQHLGLADARHVLEADFGSAGFNYLVGDGGIVFCRMDGRGGDAERGLRRHAALEGILDGGDDVAHVVQTAEDTGDVHALGVLHLVHQAAHVGRHGEHTQGVEAAVEHVRLDAHFVEGLGEGADGFVGVLAVEQVDLLEGAAVGLDAGEASHLDDYGSNALQLVLTGLEFAAALKHVTIDKAELDFAFRHNVLDIRGDLRCRRRCVTPHRRGRHAGRLWLAATLL